ncbi:hypothetical protein WA026_004447 [Henosepilachna vigintioctopunctata]|uniref:Uncharacterized protein n=1 Tax=Henosepilachna vigintioctopunctata TaxID=420089 RepID=A0AAW1V0H8_9CUCU
MCNLNISAIFFTKYEASCEYNMIKILSVVSSNVMNNSIGHQLMKNVLIYYLYMYIIHSSHDMEIHFNNEQTKVLSSRRIYLLQLKLIKNHICVSSFSKIRIHYIF